jgi:hypothetical protein
MCMFSYIILFLNLLKYNDDDDDDNNSIQFFYLCANSTAQRPITKLARVNESK